ncbi:hypothetical protein Tco_1343646 [Tanacetum coccineum]
MIESGNKLIQFFGEMLLEQAANIDQSPPQEMSIQDMENLKQHYLDEMLSLSNDLHFKDYRNEKIDIHFRRECESIIDELKDVRKKNVKTYSNPLFEFDDEYISSAVNPHFDEVLENIENMDISTDIENGYHDSEGDIIYLESLIIDDTIPNLPLEVFLDHDARSLKDELDKEDLKSMVKVFDPGIHENTFSPTYVKLPFEDRHYLSFTYVIGNFFLISPIRWIIFFSTLGVKTPFLTPAFPFLVLSRWYLIGVELLCASIVLSKHLE